jgi:hypothetical protein
MNLFTTPNPLLKQEGEYLMCIIQEFPLLNRTETGGGIFDVCNSRIPPPVSGGGWGW